MLSEDQRGRQRTVDSAIQYLVYCLSGEHIKKNKSLQKIRDAVMEVVCEDQQKMSPMEFYPYETVEKNPQIGEVWKNNETNIIFVVKSEGKLQDIKDGDYTRIADFAHQNDDFSYFCRNAACRCMQ